VVEVFTKLTLLQNNIWAKGLA